MKKYLFATLFAVIGLFTMDASAATSSAITSNNAIELQENMYLSNEMDADDCTYLGIYDVYVDGCYVGTYHVYAC